MAKFELTPASRRYIGERIAEHLSRENAFTSDISYLTNASYVGGAEMVLMWLEIPHRVHMSDDHKRYVSFELDGETFPVPSEEATP